MVSHGDVVSYLEMCADFGVNLQRGMNYHLKGNESLILMSVRHGAPYADRLEEGGRIIIYEGHDIPKIQGGPEPKDVDQPEFLPSGRLTQNGLFLDAARRYKLGRAEAERIRVFEKSGMASGPTTASSDSWMFGKRRPTDARYSSSNSRSSISPR